MFSDDFPEPLAGSDGDGRLGDDHFIAGHVCGNATADFLHKRQVSGSIALRGSAYGNKDDESFINGFDDICREAQPAFFDSFGDQFSNARFEKWHLSLFQLLNPPGVVIHAGDVDAELCKTGSRDKADVTGSNDADMHGIGSPW